MEEGDISQEKEVKDSKGQDSIQEGIREGNKQVCYLRIHLKLVFLGCTPAKQVKEGDTRQEGVKDQEKGQDSTHEGIGEGNNSFMYECI